MRQELPPRKSHAPPHPPGPAGSVPPVLSQLPLPQPGAPQEPPNYRSIRAQQHISFANGSPDFCSKPRHHGFLNHNAPVDLLIASVFSAPPNFPLLSDMVL